MFIQELISTLSTQKHYSIFNIVEDFINMDVRNFHFSFSCYCVIDDTCAHLFSDNGMVFI